MGAHALEIFKLAQDSLKLRLQSILIHYVITLSRSAAALDTRRHHAQIIRMKTRTCLCALQMKERPANQDSVWNILRQIAIDIGPHVISEPQSIKFLLNCFGLLPKLLLFPTRSSALQ